MKVLLGEEGLRMSWQEAFPSAVPCAHCKKGMADIGFVAYEGMDDDDAPVYPRDYVQYVTDLQTSTGEAGTWWPHDCIAVAVYFCRQCLEVTTRWNQA